MGGGAGPGGAGAGGGLDPADIERLRSSPAFQQIRDLVGTNPAYLQSFVQQLAAANPALAQQLSQNPELLLQLLGGAGGMMGEGGEGEGGEWDGEGAPPPGAQVLSVTAEERDAIARVSVLSLL